MADWIIQVRETTMISVVDDRIYRRYDVMYGVRQYHITTWRNHSAKTMIKRLVNHIAWEYGLGFDGTLFSSPPKYICSDQWGEQTLIPYTVRW